MVRKGDAERKEILVKVTANKPTKCGNIFSEEILRMIHQNNKHITKFDETTKTLTFGKKALYLLLNGVAAVEAYDEEFMNK